MYFISSLDFSFKNKYELEAVIQILMCIKRQVQDLLNDPGFFLFFPFVLIEDNERAYLNIDFNDGLQGSSATMVNLAAYNSDQVTKL